MDKRDFRRVRLSLSLNVLAGLFEIKFCGSVRIIKFYLPNLIEIGIK